MLKPKATQARVVKVPQPSPHAGEEEEEEFELQGQMLIVGNMFKKKLIEVLTALQAGKKKWSGSVVLLKGLKNGHSSDKFRRCCLSIGRGLTRMAMSFQPSTTTTCFTTISGRKKPSKRRKKTNRTSYIQR